MSEVRRYVKLQKEAQRRAEEEQAVMQQQAMAAESEALQRAEQTALMEKQQDRADKYSEKLLDQDGKMEQIYAKGMMGGQRM